MGLLERVQALTVVGHDLLKNAFRCGAQLLRVFHGHGPLSTSLPLLGAGETRALDSVRKIFLTFDSDTLPTSRSATRFARPRSGRPANWSAAANSTTSIRM